MDCKVMFEPSCEAVWCTISAINWCTLIRQCQCYGDILHPCVTKCGEGRLYMVSLGIAKPWKLWTYIVFTHNFRRKHVTPPPPKRICSQWRQKNDSREACQGAIENWTHDLLPQEVVDIPLGHCPTFHSLMCILDVYITEIRADVHIMVQPIPRELSLLFWQLDNSWHWDQTSSDGYATGFELCARSSQFLLTHTPRAAICQCVSVYSLCESLPWEMWDTWIVVVPPKKHTRLITQHSGMCAFTLLNVWSNAEHLN